MRKRTALFFCVVTFVLGTLVGAGITARSQRRPGLPVAECVNCWNPSEVSGLVTSVLLRRAPGAVPLREIETERTLVIRHPFPRKPKHFVLFPKRDIKNAGSLAPGDEAYLVDLFAVLGQLVRENRMTRYEVWSNGPGEQSVAYLHFHLAGE